MSQVSSNVVWDVVRRESCFLRKTKNIELSAEPLNVRSVNSYKFSGLSQPGVGVKITRPSKPTWNGKVQLLRATKHSNKPVKAVATIGLTHGLKRSQKALTKAMSFSNYRPDLKRDACAKYSALSRANARRVNGVSLPTKTRRGRK